MAKSTQVITDLKSAVTTAFGATGEAAAVNPALIMQSPEGIANLALIKAQELLKLLNDLLIDPTGVGVTNAVIKSGDPNFTVLDSVRQVLV
jgi:hypothetical protein